ncbi:MAG: RecX family transcriptional regulator, partial [Anaerolineae bacterium]|nr:RecX family transcriptional regulator [Anaerolineae bacterium]
MSTITALEVQKRNKERVNVYLDGEYAFSLEAIKAAALHKGQQLSDSEVEALRGDDEVARAVETAARFLAYRPRSVAEVRRNLIEKGMPDPVIDAALERLNAQGYLDDRAFAIFWVENRRQFKPLSPRALRYELRQKGVPNTIINDVLDGLDARDTAYRAAESQVRRLRGSSKDDFRHKLDQFLQRRGFSHEAARDVIEQLIEELESQDEQYFDRTHE